MPKSGSDEKSLGRRKDPRVLIGIPIVLKWRSVEGTFSTRGHAISLSASGLACRVERLVPKETRAIGMTLHHDSRPFSLTGKLVWSNPGTKEYGIAFSETPNEWINQDWLSNFKKIGDRRGKTANPRNKLVSRKANRPAHGQRYADLIGRRKRLKDNSFETADSSHFLRIKSAVHDSETVQGRRKWIEAITGTALRHVTEGSEPFDEFNGKIENLLGVAHTPLGLAGPLKINGDYARGTFYVPLATTEGALVTSYTLGSHIVTRAGGVNVKILKDELRMAPMFIFPSMRESDAFRIWIEAHSKKIKEIAESTSRHLTLTQTSALQDGRRIILNFHYSTADAMGMNMAGKATEAVCNYLRAIVKPEEFLLRSNFNSNKKASGQNFINGYGKTVIADITIPRRLVAVMHTTPEEMERYCFRALLSATHAMQIGSNGHFANGLTALFIACGQDVASVATSHVGVSACEVTRAGDLYVSAYLSNLLCGTVGGGTGFGTARECLSLMGCIGYGKSKKFAEIAAALALAGEISIAASIVNGTYVLAHEMFGRNRPKVKPTRSIRKM